MEIASNKTSDEEETIIKIITIAITIFLLLILLLLAKPIITDRIWLIQNTGWFT